METERQQTTQAFGALGLAFADLIKSVRHSHGNDAAERVYVIARSMADLEADLFLTLESMNQ